MTKKLTPFKIKDSGEEIVIFPVSIVAEMMLAKDASPEPKAPLLEVNIGGVVTAERNPANPAYREAWNAWNTMIEIEATQRTLRKIALKQSLTPEQREEVAEIREALEGLEPLPKSDKILWFFKVAIGSDQDIQAIAQAVGKLADPQEERIADKAKMF